MAYYGDDIVERVREATDIVDLIEEFLPLKRRGRNYWARCPFHQEKTPSFSVSPDKQIFHCFGCQKGGNVFGFVMEYEKLPFPEALKYLAQRAGIELPTHQARTESKEIERLYFAHEMAADFFFENLKSSTATLDYLRKRGIKDDTIRKFRIGYAPDSWDALTNHAHSKDLDDQDLIRAGLVVERDDGGVYDQVWSYGHRNPYGLAQAEDGRIWEIEMGPAGGDELNLIERGANYGYPIVSNGEHYDGRPIPDHDTRPEFKAPATWWTPVISPGDMLIYGGDAFADWQGDAFIAGLSSKAIIRVELHEDGSAEEVERYDMGVRIRALAENAAGQLLVLEDERDGAGGRLLRLSPAN
jgi:hypothetical protein